MRYSYAITAALCWLAIGAPTGADAWAEAKTWGWRGDGTGLFPDADPPIKWGRLSATIKGLSTQAEKPKDKADGATNSATDGQVAEWLILGPLTSDAAFDEASLRPDAGDETAGRTWKNARSDGLLLHANQLLPDLASEQAVYLHAYMHSKTGGKVLMRMQGMGKEDYLVWLNGQNVYQRKTDHSRHAYPTFTFKKGWNRLLVKLFAGVDGTAYFRLAMFGNEENDTYTTDGIRWAVQPPQGGIRFSCAQPLIVGDRIFVNSDPNFLSCYDKLTGKRLWVTYNGPFECVTPQERKAHPDLFAQLDPKVKRIKELANRWQGALAEKQELNELVDDVAGLMRQVDRKRYVGTDSRQEAGVAGSTPVTDGQHVYSWYANGVAACHDLNGNRKWIVSEHEGRRKDHDRYDRHGYYVSPLLTEDEFVVSMVNLIGFDKETGEIKWRMGGHIKWPPVSAFKAVAGTEVNYIDFPELGLYVPGEGWHPWSTCTMVDNVAYVQRRQGRQVLVIGKLPHEPNSATTIPRESFSHERLAGGKPLHPPGGGMSEMVVANVLVFKGLVYVVNLGGVLEVIDAETYEPVYTEHLDLNTFKFAYPYPHGSGVCASPTAAGDYVYLWGNGGMVLVIKSGRKFEVVAKNRIERLLPGNYFRGWVRLDGGAHRECTVSSPVFDGDRLFYQAESFLYCIGKPQ